MLPRPRPPGAEDAGLRNHAGSTRLCHVAPAEQPRSRGVVPGPELQLRGDGHENEPLQAANMLPRPRPPGAEDAGLRNHAGSTRLCHVAPAEQPRSRGVVPSPELQLRGDEHENEPLQTTNMLPRPRPPGAKVAGLRNHAGSTRLYCVAPAEQPRSRGVVPSPELQLRGDNANRQNHFNFLNTLSSSRWLRPARSKSEAETPPASGERQWAMRVRRFRM